MIDEKALGIFILGVISALENELITPEESEVILFNPYVWQSLKNMNVNYHLRAVVSRGMEADDVHRLVPEGYEGLIRGLKEECKKYLSEAEELKYPVMRYSDFYVKCAGKDTGGNH